MSFVQLSLEYFPDPTRGVPVFNGHIYIGEPSTDPEIPGNQKTVTLRQSDGTETPALQPIRTGAGGVALLNGSPVQMLVDGIYSLKVLDEQQAQVYYIENVVKSVEDPLVGSGLLLASLRALIPITNGELAITGGRLVYGDDGGGTFYWNSSALSTEVTADTESGIYVAPDSDLTGASGAWVRLLGDSVLPEWFGAKTDGVTDDAAALNACVLFAASVNKQVPLSGVYAVKAPVLLPDGLRMRGVVGTSNEAKTQVQIKAVAPFVSSHTMAYWDTAGGGSSEVYNVAAVLLSKAWADGEYIGQPCHLTDFMVDADGLYDDRGSVIHGYLAYNQINYCNIGVHNTTGYGVWHNAQTITGVDSFNMVDCHWDRIRVDDTGVNDDTYTINGVTNRYNAFHFGTLEGSATTAAGHTVISGHITDGRITNCTVAVKCSGNGIRCANGSGWLVRDNHLNGCGTHGIRVTRGIATVITGNIVDGFGYSAPASFGELHGIAVTSILGRSGTYDSSGPIINSNTVRLWEPGERSGNTFSFIQATGSGAAAGIMCLISDNTLALLSNVTEPINSILSIAVASGGGFNCTVRNNKIDKDAYMAIFSSSSSAVVHDHAGNSWQVVSSTGLDITGAVNNGAGLIRITSTAHGLFNGDKVYVVGVVGTTEANAAWIITAVTADTFDLSGSTFTNAYISGGWMSEKSKRGWLPLGYRFDVLDGARFFPDGYKCIVEGYTPALAAFGYATDGATSDRPLLDASDTGFTFYDYSAVLALVWHTTTWKKYNTNMVNA